MTHITSVISVGYFRVKLNSDTYLCSSDELNSWCKRTESFRNDLGCVMRCHSCYWTVCEQNRINPCEAEQTTVNPEWCFNVKGKSVFSSCVGWDGQCFSTADQHRVWRTGCSSLNTIVVWGLLIVWVLNTWILISNSMAHLEVNELQNLLENIWTGLALNH